MSSVNPVKSITAMVVISSLLVMSAIMIPLQYANAFFSKNITVEIKAKVTSVSDFSNLLKGAIKEGDIITGKYVYNSLAKDTNDDPTVGDYQHNSKPYGIILKAGKLVFQTDPRNVNFLLELVNRDDSDNFVIHSYNNLPLSKKVTLGVISWQLDDPTTTVLSSVSLKDNPKAPDLSKWQQPFGLSIEGFSAVDEDLEGFSIRGEVFSAKAVSHGEDKLLTDRLGQNLFDFIVKALE
jgi:hypothetical protein